VTAADVDRAVGDVRLLGSLFDDLVDP